MLSHKAALILNLFLFLFYFIYFILFLFFIFYFLFSHKYLCLNSFAQINRKKITVRFYFLIWYLHIVKLI